ncbi:MAG: hypothetical protein JRF36_14545 [Deltaproteobacteria bacterium]|nr:hypothetical protein [Deltaproteobacteria bacterium]
MASKRKSKKSVSKIPPKTAERIVAISLQHPELGARRLVPLLKKKRISVSAAAIQSVLRREGLQNREKRLAQIKKHPKKTPKPKPSPKKPAPRITDDAAERICEISLQNPDLGAKSLAPLLKEKGIFVSSSAVYRILKHYGLQTRAKRYAKAAEITSQPVIIPKTFPEKIPPEVEDRIVEISLQNPEFGTRRLIPLLQQEEIFVSTSAVYRILKRHDLENQQKRLLNLEALQAPEAPPEPEIEETELIAEVWESEQTAAVDEAPEPDFAPAVVASLPLVDKSSKPETEPEPTAEVAQTEPTPAVDEGPEPTPAPAVAEAAETAKPERPPVRKTPIKTIKKRGHWVFYPLYLLLFILLGYLGLHAVRTIQYARMDTQTIQIDDSVAVGIAARTLISEQPLDGYRQIWERNLFNTGSVKGPDPEEKIALAKLVPAKKGLGLELVGTVVADDPRLSRAIIDNRSIRKQEVYREGDNAGKVKIKKILRNNVVITTDDGDELLTVEIKESAKSAPAAQSPYIGSQSSSAQQASMTRQQRVRTSSIRLKRDELADSFADIDELMEQMKITAYKSGDEASGFRLGSITRDSVLRKMGLRSRDVIVGIDDETITSPDQAADFFKRLADGGEVTIKLKRRRRTRQIRLNIE